MEQVRRGPAWHQPGCNGRPSRRWLSCKGPAHAAAGSVWGKAPGRTDASSPRNPRLGKSLITTTCSRDSSVNSECTSRCVRGSQPRQSLAEREGLAHVNSPGRFCRASHATDRPCEQRRRRGKPAAPQPRGGMVRERDEPYSPAGPDPPTEPHQPASPRVSIVSTHLTDLPLEPP